VAMGVLLVKPFVSSEKHILPTFPAKSDDGWITLNLTASERNGSIARLAFALEHEKQLAGYQLAQHLLVRAPLGAGGAVVERAYAPCCLDRYTRGSLEMHVKVYPGGLMSNYLSELRPGAQLQFSGPRNSGFAGHGSWPYVYKHGSMHSLGILAGGTGMFAMLNIIREALMDGMPVPKNAYGRQGMAMVSLIYAAKKEEDLVFRAEIDAMSARHGDRFKVLYVLEEPPAGWEGGVGFITQEMIQARFTPPMTGVQVLNIGPVAMTEAMWTHLKTIGYQQMQVFHFDGTGNMADG